jgi:hypothetical protein
MSNRTGSKPKPAANSYANDPIYLPMSSRHPFKKVGGAGRDRTDDPLLAKQVLSQLSYGPNSSSYPSTGGCAIRRDALPS